MRWIVVDDLLQNYLWAAAERNRNVGRCESTSDCRKHHEHQCEADRCAQAIEDGLDKAFRVLNIEQGNAKYGAIRREQRDLSPQYLVQ